MSLDWTRAGSGRATHLLVFCDPCNGLAPIFMQHPRAFFAGQAIVALLALIVLGLWALLLPQI